MDKFEVKLDQAARAAWLSYVGGQTQDEIAAQLGVSRPGVQRLLALARQEGLVKVHIDHPIAHCTALSQAIRERFALDYCDVVPVADNTEDSARYLSVAGAERLSRIIERSEPQTLSLGSGRSIRATVEALSRIDRPRHRFVSLVGNVARDGSSNRYDGVMVAADKTGGERYLLPTPGGGKLGGGEAGAGRTAAVPCHRQGGRRGQCGLRRGRADRPPGDTVPGPFHQRGRTRRVAGARGGG